MSNKALGFRVKQYLSALNEHRKRIRRFDPESVAIVIAERLRYIGNDVQRVRQSPYNDLYHILKLAILGSNSRYAQQRQFSLGDLGKLLQFYGSSDFPHLEIAETEGDPVCMKLNFVAACQFPFQVSIGTTDIGRTIHLFRDAAWTFDLEQAFEETTGIRIEDFLLVPAGGREPLILARSRVHR